VLLWEIQQAVSNCEEKQAPGSHNCREVAMVLCTLHTFIKGTGDVISTSELAASDFVASHVLGRHC
jgi:hypothetical protein